MYRILIEPIEKFLLGEYGQSITFSIEQALLLLPFAALQDSEGVYLVEKYAISLTPSIQMIAVTQEMKDNIDDKPLSELAPDEVLVVGNPTSVIPKTDPTDPGEQEFGRLQDLPYAEQEARNIAQLFDTAPLLGEAAKKSIVLERMNNARIVHFATHGSLDVLVWQGMRSASLSADRIPGAIVLSPDNSGANPRDAQYSVLTANEINDLTDNGTLERMRTELMVLSACENGFGGFIGDDIVGFPYVFWMLGVPTTVASFWIVEDQSTSILMSEFYNQRLQGESKARSLQLAMLKTKESYPDPGYWAPFALFG